MGRIWKTYWRNRTEVLHSQINPHFIFNTLNTISHQALLEGATKIQEIICVFAELLRSTLRNMGKILLTRRIKLY